jgi:hypothetical protein
VSLYRAMAWKSLTVGRIFVSLSEDEPEFDVRLPCSRDLVRGDVLTLESDHFFISKLHCELESLGGN